MTAHLGHNISSQIRRFPLLWPQSLSWKIGHWAWQRSLIRFIDLLIWKSLWGAGDCGGVEQKRKRRRNSWIRTTAWWLPGRGGVGGGGGYAGINGDGRRLDLGWWTHNIVCRWCVVELCTWNCIILLTSVTPIKSIKRKKILMLRDFSFIVTFNESFLLNSKSAVRYT